MALQDIADYYLRLSDKLDGVDNNGDNDDGSRVKRPAFSLNFFYGTDQTYPDGRRMGNLKNISSNSLLKAFFGDAEELENIANGRREELTDDEIAGYCINGNYLNDAQKDAVRKALSNNVTIIQGPPGTGKTEVILNILSCIHKKYPDDTVMLLSGNYEAVKNITDKIDHDKEKYPLLKELYDVYLPLGNQTFREGTYKQRIAEELDVSFFNTDTYCIEKERLGDIKILSSTIHSVKKLYTNRKDGNTQYDYVIVDECSQVSILLGLIALSCGKRIVLLGDREQLAPVIKADNVRDINHECGIVPDLYKEMPEKSFLEVCESVFGEIDGTAAFLSGHYRCHPSIINFCNRFVYNGELNVCTDTVRNGMADADKLMIRVLWYEGDYFETYSKQIGNDVNGLPKYQEIKINERQIDIFMNEEFPYIIDKLREDKEYSVCVIAPYRFIIDTLSDRITERYTELKDEIEISEDENELISRLTIHKAQGKGFDGVWFLSGQDAGSEYRWPWGQQKRMINVTVSRAKKEFTVITSSSWMPKAMQYELTNYCELTTPDLDDEQNNLMINKLIEYVENDCANLDKGERYGIRKAETKSLFDKNLYYRKRFTTRKSYNDKKYPSAPELIMMDYLIEEYSRDFDILREIPFSAYSPNITSYEYRSDFAICRENKVIVIIEVDGEFHRSDPEQAKNDKEKDQIIAEAKTDTALVRISTNDLDIEQTISKALNSALEGDSFITIDETEKKAAVKRCIYSIKCGGLASYLRNVINNSFEDFCEDYKNNRNAAAIRANNYVQPDTNDFMYDDKMAADYYLCRYGMCYAFEYSLMYKLVLKSMTNSGEQLKGLLSIGCGSMIDGWSMAYAYSMLNYSEGHMPPRFKYMGVDCKEWAVKFIDPKKSGEKIGPSVYMQPFSEVSFFQGFAQDYLRSLIDGKTAMDYNVICFPKILNELDSAAADEIAEYFSKLEFPLDEYYVCASYGRSTRSTDAEILKKIIDKINETGEFEVIYNLNEMNINIEQGNVLRAVYPYTDEELVFADQDVPCELNSYVFKSSITRDAQAAWINKIDPRFNNQRISSYFRELSSKNSGIKNVVTRVSEITFQIVKLKRKG